MVDNVPQRHGYRLFKETAMKNIIVSLQSITMTFNFIFGVSSIVILHQKDSKYYLKVVSISCQGDHDQ